MRLCQLSIVSVYSGRGQRGRSRSRSRSTTPDLETATGGGDSHKRELSAGANGPPNKKQRCKDYDGQ